MAMLVPPFCLFVFMCVCLGRCLSEFVAQIQERRNRLIEISCNKLTGYYRVRWSCCSVQKNGRVTRETTAGQRQAGSIRQASNNIALKNARLTQRKIWHRISQRPKIKYRCRFTDELQMRLISRRGTSEAVRSRNPLMADRHLWQVQI